MCIGHCSCLNVFLVCFYVFTCLQTPSLWDNNKPTTTTTRYNAKIKMFKCSSLIIKHKCQCQSPFIWAHMLCIHPSFCGKWQQCVSIFSASADCKYPEQTGYILHTAGSYLDNYNHYNQTVLCNSCRSSVLLPSSGNSVRPLY